MCQRLLHLYNNDMNTKTQYEILTDDSPPTRPEWLRIEAAVKLFGISRSTLYKLITERRIKSFCLRERNKVKGIRLLSYDSLCAFLEAEAAAQDEKAATGLVIV